MYQINPIVADFVKFCAQRCGNQWPALYDEMTRVSARRLFRGMGYNDLHQLGLSLSLYNMDEIAKMVNSTMKVSGD